MSQFLLASRSAAPAPVPVPRAAASGGPVAGIPVTGDRRRPGRIENASPELIALMRKPTRAARMRVALYDAPGFILAPDPRGAVSARNLGHMAIAFAACSAACAAAFKTMLVVWG